MRYIRYLVLIELTLTVAYNTPCSRL